MREAVPMSSINQKNRRAEKMNDALGSPLRV